MLLSVAEILRSEVLLPLLRDGLLVCYSELSPPPGEHRTKGGAKGGRSQRSRNMSYTSVTTLDIFQA